MDRRLGRPDLVDRSHRVVVEADSFESHSDTASLHRDVERYNAFVGAGHLVLRLGWHHALFRQDYVRAAVSGGLAARERSAQRCDGCVAA